MLARIALDRVNVHLGDRHVLRDVTWTLEPPAHWAFIGPNGSGKSTLLRVIAGSGWIDGDGGTRTYSPDGQRRDAVARAATWIRYVSAEQHERYVRLDLPLDGHALVQSGLDDAVYVHRQPADDDAARVDALIERFELHAFARRPMRELSSGQIRRLLIARALVRQPQVLVLDEFTNGLDRGAKHDVLAFLDRIAPQVTLVIASHRAADFPAAITHTATLANGRIASAGEGRPRHHRPSRAFEAHTRNGRGDEPLLLRLRNADVYRGRTLVLAKVNWDIRRGEHTAIRGANGAGKTTFAGLLAGTISAATGAQIVRFGETGPFDIWKLKERIAHVSDDLQIAYDRAETVADVVASGFTASIGLVVQPTAAQRSAAREILARMGLEPLSDRIFTQLSFGERRKILIARSLVRRPALFILDEIWNGLDAAFRHALRALLAELAQTGTTLVTIAHDEDDDLAGLVKRVFLIENQAIREVAPARDGANFTAGVAAGLARVANPRYLK